MTAPARPAFPDAAPGLAAAAGPSCPVAGQSAITTAGMRAAADLTGHSGITGLPVACAAHRISIQVTVGTRTASPAGHGPSGPTEKKEARS
jgi:hypothetical protein